MQHMYAGDIGDYDKYGLLRTIMPAISKSGKVWYLVPNNGKKPWAEWLLKRYGWWKKIKNNPYSVKRIP